jgi:hypothetical protein
MGRGNKFYTCLLEKRTHIFIISIIRVGFHLNNVLYRFTQSNT